MPWEPPAPAPVVLLGCASGRAGGGAGVVMAQSWSLHWGWGLWPAQLWSLCPPPPPLLLCSAGSLEAGCAAGVSRRPSQGCPQEGKVRHLFSPSFCNSVCGLIGMLRRAAALEQVLLCQSVELDWLSAFC